MPANEALRDIEIAQIATYIYNEWGHAKGFIPYHPRGRSSGPMPCSVGQISVSLLILHLPQNPLIALQIRKFPTLLDQPYRPWIVLSVYEEYLTRAVTFWRSTVYIA